MNEISELLDVFRPYIIGAIIIIPSVFVVMALINWLASKLKKNNMR